MKLKTGVRPTGVDQGLTIGLMAADGVFSKYRHTMTITSLNDSRHSETSLHYSGAAADLRTRDLPDQETKQAIRDEIKEALTSDYDVILESDHIHLEYQPRRP